MLESWNWYAVEKSVVLWCLCIVKHPSIFRLFSLRTQVSTFLFFIGSSSLRSPHFTSPLQGLSPLPLWESACRMCFYAPGVGLIKNWIREIRWKLQFSISLSFFEKAFCSPFLGCRSEVTKVQFDRNWSWIEVPQSPDSNRPNLLQHHFSINIDWEVISMWMRCDELQSSHISDGRRRRLTSFSRFLRMIPSHAKKLS